ncbi:LLM class flavin-dependent oxidoreductase [Deinococcus sp. Arct2-2]|uniref:LLM class flavin-dependent oxidoreductase n=1 Tax=Deinococcus sp. Arct2-2 TaxID=2568653 RepID=UPI0010A56F7C|nr:LLM class flavin-dependent oxidoreductase [Deinococcus sp. Arct2-2]THF69713.1 LLM class flavin-dependent oxidoreductase [Deinococcus sp. Arct2-2]
MTFLATSPILSVLDLVPLASGSSSTQAVLDTIDLAQHVEALGYRRYWLAEHHNMQSLVSSAPELLIAALSQRTTTLRLGSGGIMLPNHAPLKVAETFRLLEALAPDRIDLGLGRAPGTDLTTALALRRSRGAVQADDFEAQLAELLAFSDQTPPSSSAARPHFPADHPFRGIVAAPYDQPLPPLWMLSSSGHGAAVAAELGAGLAFATHINPDLPLAAQSIAHYRAAFQPSATFAQPQVIVAQSVILADTDEEAARLALPLVLMFLRLMRGEGAPFASVEEAEAYPYSAAERAQLGAMQRSGRVVAGGPDTVKARLDHVLQVTGAQELMVGSLMHRLADRKRAYELLANLYPQQASLPARPLIHQY